MMRGQRRGGWQFTSKTVLALLAIVAMCCSAVYWWGVQSQLTGNLPMAVAFTAILVLAPPVLVSFLIPWSPGGMLLQKINARTWGYVVVILCAGFLMYYSFEIQYSWWAAQPVVADTGLIWQQVLVGIVGFIIIPALLWTPVTSEELVEQVRQAHLVKRYEMQAQADIAILRNTLLRAQEQALVGFANLSTAERQELADAMQGLVKGIDKTLQDVGQSVKKVSGATVPFSSLEDNDDIRDYLDYIHESLTYNSLDNERDDTRLPDVREDMVKPRAPAEQMAYVEDERAPRRSLAIERYEDERPRPRRDTRPPDYAEERTSRRSRDVLDEYERDYLERRLRGRDRHRYDD